MRHENSVFHQIQQHIPWGEFDRLVDEHKADHRSRTLSTKTQFLALLFAQLAGASSLREIEASLCSQQARLYHVGGRPVARSTLADANARRPAALYGKLFAHLVARASGRTRRHVRDAVRLLDATRVRVSSLYGGWADMVGGHKGIKLHIAYDPKADIPQLMALTGQKTSDITPAKEAEIMPGMTYVFDMAYYDFAWWAELDSKGCRFVTRLKNNTHLEHVIEAPVKKGTSILSDSTGLLPRRMARSRRNPLSDPLREITVRISTGKRIRLVTNDLDAPAEEIADLYKQRWQIELFFKWIKQNLKIRRFLGTSENAVRLQVFIALIAYLLLRMAQAAQTQIAQPLTFRRMVRLNLMHAKPIGQLLAQKPPATFNTDQLSFADLI